LANDDFSKFGFYSHSTHNQNSRNTGYKNTLNVDSNFSTTIGANFTTVVGGNFSTTGGLTMSTVVGFNMPVTLGGKIELIFPWSIKWTYGIRKAPDAAPTTVPDTFQKLTGGYDYDFKDCETQLKWNEGQVYNYSVKSAIELNKDKAVKVVDKKKEFSTQADQWIGTQLSVIGEKIEQVESGTMKYGYMHTTVANSCNINVGIGKSVLSMTTTGATLYSAGTVLISGATELKLKCAAKASWSAAILNLG